MTAAAVGGLGQVRRDPMAMLPFSGYHIGDYFRHWIEMQRSLRETPLVFHVNWFRKDAQGKFLWPGYGENMRVLRWIVDRVHGRALAKDSPIGWQPCYQDLDWNGLSFSKQQFEELQRFDGDAWHSELERHKEFFLALEDHLPRELLLQRELLILRIQ